MSLVSPSKKRLYLSPPHLGGLEERYIKEALESNWITSLGPQLDAFERDLADYVNTKSVVALSSGTAGLHLGLKALGVKAGDVVLCSSLTFVASANPILYEGAEPVLIDSDLETWNISPKAFLRAVEELRKEGRLPKAAVIVNLYGQSADYDPILEICRKYKIAILEDAAESLGATYKDKKSGTLGDIGVFSFNGNKIITTSGGGAVVSQNEELLQKIRFWSTQAREPVPYYEHSEVGYNYRMSNLLAAVGRGQLRVLEDRVRSRREIFERYQSTLSQFEGIRFISEKGFGRSTRWLSAFSMVPRQNLTPSDIISALEKENIEARHVWKPLHLMPLFRKYRFFSDHTSSSYSESLFNWGVVLPSGSQMTPTEQARVIDIISSLLKGR